MAIELKDWTLEVWKLDRRRKEGRFLERTYDYKNTHEGWMHEELRDLGGLYPAHKYHLKFVPTWVERVNAMTGEKFLERYDTPWTCSPASETYWSA